MSEKNEIPQVDEPMSEEIRIAFAQIRAARGACPGADELIQFQQLALPAPAMARLKQHIESCGRCDGLVAGLKRFDADSEEAAKRVKEKTPGAGLIHGLRGFFLQPAFAYLMVLALLYPAYRGLFQEPRTIEKIVKEKQIEPVVVGGAGSARDFNLGEATAQRSESSQSPMESAHTIKLGKEEKFFILNFFVPVRGQYDYTMEIRAAQGTIVAAEKIRSRDRLGNFSLVGSRAQFPDGEYILQVKETERQTGQVIATHSFKFQVMEES